MATRAIYISVVAAGTGLATGAGMEAGAAQGRLQRAEQRVSTLSVAAERERIGRDLHDILGHSLTAISIKAGLAARLVDLDPAAAKAQIAEIEQVSRQALADVRTTASGMREVRLATEIASARSVLLAAGIESRMPSALPPLSDQASELMGYVVREAVTNVVRHSRAGVCTIVVEPTAVEVRDDGRGLPTGVRSGSGLVGLRSRVEATGGTLQVGAGESGGTVVRAELWSPAAAQERARPAPGGDRPVITVLLADDQAMIRQAFTALLQLEADIRVVGQAGDVAETVRKVDETVTGGRAARRADALAGGPRRGRDRRLRGDHGRATRAPG